MKSGTALERVLEVSSGGPIRAIGGKGIATGMVNDLGRCSAANRGEELWLRGAAGVADSKHVCLKNAADAYAWVGITPFSAVLVGSETFNPGNITGGNTLSETVTVTGAAVGDTCEASFTTATTTASLTQSCRVTSTDTCTVVWINNTGGGLDMAEGTLTCVVSKRA